MLTNEAKCVLLWLFVLSLILSSLSYFLWDVPIWSIAFKYFIAFTVATFLSWFCTSPNNDTWQSPTMALFIVLWVIYVSYYIVMGGE